MADRKPFVIVGAGLAGAKAAEALRKRGFDGRVLLVGAEAERPYERPPLSKTFLTGATPREEAYVHPAAFYADRDIELLTGCRVTALDAAAHRVDLDDGTSVEYRKLLLATGAVPRRPPIDGTGLDGVHVLRTLADADALRRRLSPGGTLAIIGRGWIGCEVAASARQLGVAVELVEHGEAPLKRVLGPELGRFFAAVHRDHGVRVRVRTRVERIEGAGRVERVRLADGTTIACDAVVVAVGVAPDTRLAADAGLLVDDGVVVDERLRAGAPDVFAAGDVARARHPRYGRNVRVEHWANAVEQGAAAAASMLGDGRPYAEVPYFFSDQYELGMEYTGLHGPSDRLVVRGDLGSGEFVALWLDSAGRAVAGMHVNDWDAMEPIRALVARSAPVAPHRLTDRSIPLDAVAEPASVAAAERG